MVRVRVSWVELVYVLMLVLVVSNVSVCVSNISVCVSNVSVSG